MNFLLLWLFQDLILALVCISASEDPNIIIINNTQSVQACKAVIPVSFSKTTPFYTSYDKITHQVQSFFGCLFY